MLIARKFETLVAYKPVAYKIKCVYSVCYLLDAGILARYVFTQPVKLSMVTINAFDVLKVKTRFL